MFKKRWFKILAFLVILLVVAVGVVIWQLDSIAKRAINIAGTSTLGVDTDLDSIHIGLLTGEVKMQKLKVSNPAGFTSPHFMALGRGEVAASLGTLLEETVVLPKLELDGIDINLEKKGDSANYDVILANLKKQDSQDKDAQAGKKFIIKEVIISNVSVHADVVPLAGKAAKINITIPQIRLTDVGSDSANGVAMAEVTNVLMKSVFKAILESGVGLPPEIGEGISGGLAKLQDVGKLGVEAVGDISKNVGEAGKSVGDVGKNVGDTIGNIFGKKKDETKQEPPK